MFPFSKQTFEVKVIVRISESEYARFSEKFASK